jgi:hypothetical protein
MTEENHPPGGEHWGAPVPYPLGMPIETTPPSSPRRRILTYLALATAGTVVLAAAGFLGYRSLSGPDSDPGTGGPGGFTAQTAPGPSPSARPRISPDGAPYAFTLPRDYVQAPIPNSTGVGQSGIYETAMTPPGATGGDVIAVSVYRLGADSDAFSYAQLEAEIDPLTAKVATTRSEPRQVRIAGRRALRYLFDYGHTKVLSYFVFSGRIEVQVRCQWTSHQRRIEEGCATVTQTLEITN